MAATRTEESLYGLRSIPKLKLIDIDETAVHARCCGHQAFGAAGALEAAYYRATGKPTLFSEQMLVDCTWDLFEGELSNKGCYGA